MTNKAPWYKRVWWWIGYRGLYRIDWRIQKKFKLDRSPIYKIKGWVMGL